MTVEARHLVIRASAGAGKTFQLTNRYLRRLLDGTPAEEILAATFTRKAAGEILERVLSRLAKAATCETEAAELTAVLDAGDFTPADFRTVLARLLRELHRLRVGTLDSFFAGLATNFTLELGLPPGWRIVDPRIDQQLRSQAIAEILREQRTTDITRLTNLLAKGDAGRSVSGLIHSTVDRFYDLYRETDAAAWQQFPELHRLTEEQLEEAIAALEAAELPDLTSWRKAREQDVQRARAEEWLTFIKTGIGAKVLAGSTKFQRREIPANLLEIYQRLLDHARAVFVQELSQQTLATRQLLESFDAAYQHLKRVRRSLRFDDVTFRLRGLSAHENAQGLAFRLDGHVAHMLLDEFQDTSPAQWDVLRPFAERIVAADRNTSFFCVGDAKQSIYAWRGGVAEIFDALDEQLPQLASLPLAKSFRSSLPVITTVNRLFGGLTNHAGIGTDDAQTVHDWCDAFPEHSTAKEDLPGYACIVSAAAGESEEGNPTDEILASTAERVAGIVRNAPWASVGVLVRKNQEVAEIMNLLRGLHIPASEEGGNPITDSAAVLTLLSLFTLADHPGDTAARYHVASSPLGESLSLVDPADDAVAAVVSTSVRQSLMADGYGPMLDRWCRALQPVCSDRDLMRLGQLIELGYRFDGEATLRPTDFVRFVEQERFLDPSADRVRVMTVHAAKGLQFDVVVAPLTEKQLTGQAPAYVAGRSGPTAPIDRVCLYRNKEIQSLLPDDLRQVFATARSREIRETLCRLYVTVTRPIHALYVIVPASRSSEKTLPRSPAGLVRAAVTQGGPVASEEILYEDGNRSWHQVPAARPDESPNADTDSGPDVAESEADSPETAPTSGAKPCIRLASMPQGRRRGLARVAPSRHDSNQPVPMSRLLRPHNAAALRRGTLIHAWFEQITWLESGRPSDSRLRQIAADQGFSTRQTETVLPHFTQMLQQPQLRRLLSQSSYTTDEDLPFVPAVNEMLLGENIVCEVRQELPIAAQLGGAATASSRADSSADANPGSDVTTGSIDRLVLLRRGRTILAADIIDFKTDAIAPEHEPDWSQRIEHYRPQLDAYATAIARICQLPRNRIAARLAFVESQTVVTLDLGDATD